MTPNLVLGAVGSVVILGLLFELMRRHHLREKYAVFWAMVAAVTLVVAVFPQTLFWASDLIGIEVPANLLFFVASMVLFGVSIQHSTELGRLEERSRTLAEEVALLRLDLESGRTDGGEPARNPGPAQGDPSPDA